jgi:predicted CoA-binding protein
MSHVNPAPSELRELLESAKTIAVVGASSNAVRPSHGIMKRLLEEGYRVIPVNPNEREVLGVPCAPSLEALAGEAIDIVNVFRRAEDTPPIADAAVKVAAKALWLQSGIVNADAAARAKAGGLTVIMDECIAVQLAVLGVSRK